MFFIDRRILLLFLETQIEYFHCIFRQWNTLLMTIFNLVLLIILILMQYF